MKKYQQLHPGSSKGVDLEFLSATNNDEIDDPVFVGGAQKHPSPCT
jgi:hypothetical protein